MCPRGEAPTYTRTLESRTRFKFGIVHPLKAVARVHVNLYMSIETNSTEANYRLHVCIYVHVCTHAQTSTYTCTSNFTTYIYILVHLRLHIPMQRHIHIHANMSTHIHVYQECAFVDLCTYVPSQQGAT